MNSQTKEFLGILNSIDFHRIKDHPNILVAANFWEKERYEAAKICYRYMRAIDDLIDNYKAANKAIGTGIRDEFISNVDDWLNILFSPDNTNPDHADLARTISRFRIPLWPLQAFARSMVYDINYDGFPTLQSFLDYSQGASVAPASIFVHLCGLTIENSDYRDPLFDVRSAATPCAIFSYVVHIIRDFQKDQTNNLNYFADETVEKNGLSRDDLRQIAAGMPVPKGFRNMIREYCALAAGYRDKTALIIKEISPLVEPRYRLSLRIIFDLYQMVFERIDAEKGNFTTSELNPTPEETRERVYRTISGFRN
jgi:phytoene/squalene synthetase